MNEGDKTHPQVRQDHARVVAGAAQHRVQRIELALPSMTRTSELFIPSGSPNLCL